MALREIIARFGFQVDSGPLEKADRSVGAMLGNLRTLGGTLAAGFAVHRVIAFAEEMTHAGDEIAKTSQRLGISTDSLQAWRHAAGASGVEAETLGAAMVILQRNTAAAARGGAEQSRAFRQLGVRFRDAHGELRGLDEMLPEIAEGFARTNNPTEKAALAMQLFGRSGAQLLPLLNEGAGGVAALRAEFERLGGGMDEATIRAAEEMDDAMGRLELSMFSLKARIAGQLLPILQRLVDGATAVAAKFANMTKNTDMLSHGLAAAGVIAAAFAAKFVVAMAPAIASSALLLGKWLLIVLAVEDVMTFFRGGDSVIGHFIDKLFGVGSTWDEVAQSIRRAEIAMRRFFGLSVEAEPSRRVQEQQLRERFERARQSRSAAPRAILGERLGRTRAQVTEAAERVRQEEAIRAEQGLALPPTLFGPVSSGGGATVDNSTRVVVNLPPGSDREQAQRVARAVEERVSQQNRQLLAGLTREIAPE